MMGGQVARKRIILGAWFVPTFIVENKLKIMGGINQVDLLLGITLNICLTQLQP